MREQIQKATHENSPFLSSLVEENIRHNDPEPFEEASFHLDRTAAV